MNCIVIPNTKGLFLHFDELLDEGFIRISQKNPSFLLCYPIRRANHVQLFSRQYNDKEKLTIEISNQSDILFRKTIQLNHRQRKRFNKNNNDGGSEKYKSRFSFL